MNKKDNIYSKRLESVKPFKFNRKTASVFDDMINRSIPDYEGLQSLLAGFSLSYYQENTYIYDVGCSTGNTVLAILNQPISKNSNNIPLIKAIDSSSEMIELAKEKCMLPNVEWVCEKAEKLSYSKASVILATYVLQFIQPDLREEILQKMYKGLRKNGVLILSEKTINPEKKIQKITNELYNLFKRRMGYSLLEIKQKEKALKNILIPYTQDKYIDLLEKTGFKKIYTIFMNLNFVTMIAIK